MLTRICFGLLLLVALPAWSQVDPSATGPSPASEEPMRTPPPVSGASYPTATGSEARSNYLRAGAYFETAYDDNVLGIDSTAPVADITYSIRPTITLDQVNARRHQSFTYSPSFTFYQRTSARNEADEVASATFQYRLSPHITVDARDAFVKTTNVLDQLDGGVSGFTQSPVIAVVAPFADQLRNAASGEISYQVDRDGMIGGGASSTVLNYPNPGQASGLLSSHSTGGSAFYNLRLSSKQYIGATYLYSRTSSKLAIGESQVATQTLYAFYTLYLRHALSLSLSGGPQYSVVSQSTLPSSSSWGPAISASAGWQGTRTSCSGSYARTVTGGDGLPGSFHSNSANADARWQWARTWTLGTSGSYVVTKNATPLSFISSPGGHSVSATAHVEHPIGERWTAAFGYTRLHQSYTGLSLITANPDSDREFVSISYQFTRPLGR